ncbi:MAG: hypothetical protein AAGF79_08905 [Pseudomonadota bacterium]
MFFVGSRVPLAILLTVIGGYLFLPERTELNLPLLPSLHKESLPAIMAVVLSFMLVSRVDPKQMLPGFLPKSVLYKALLVALLGGAIMTAMTNRDAVVIGETFLPAVRPYDAVSNAMTLFILVLPIILGRKFFATPGQHTLLLVFLAVAGLVYSLLVFFEVRMSPQLHNWTYGFFPHSWAQHVRGSDFRPVVFLSHGLLVGIFLTTALFAALGLFRVGGKYLLLGVLGALWLFITLVFSRNLGALLITVALLPAAVLFGVRLQMAVAACIALVFLSYPVLRSAEIVPVDRIVAFAEQIDPRRAQSLETRLQNEQAMLERAQERPLFGWGGWGRSRIYDENGNDVSTADGTWVIQLGLGGWTRYIAYFGLIAVPMLLSFIRCRAYSLGPETAALNLILAATLVDGIPNSSITPITWIVAGALWGRLEYGRATVTPPVEEGLANRQTTRFEPRPTRVLARDSDEDTESDEPVRTTETARPRPGYTRQTQVFTRQS